ncbi:DgyrCDS7974 [Dimorphilus gyrociliatus]|uniref:DgyrCDS7974 n=1 Tax=Dimorphilus gyrociliatus TaxID=2664684 RepID=A0A7I8VXQ3_9ANNE|nr:DgyrCDS7974 [Dimorphilus gyrociliatus]
MLFVFFFNIIVIDIKKLKYMINDTAQYFVTKARTGTLAEFSINELPEYMDNFFELMITTPKYWTLLITTIHISLWFNIPLVCYDNIFTMLHLNDSDLDFNTIFKYPKEIRVLIGVFLFNLVKIKRDSGQKMDVNDRLYTTLFYSSLIQFKLYNKAKKCLNKEDMIIVERIKKSLAIEFLPLFTNSSVCLNQIEESKGIQALVSSALGTLATNRIEKLIQSIRQKVEEHEIISILHQTGLAICQICLKIISDLSLKDIQPKSINNGIIKSKKRLIEAIQKSNYHESGLSFPEKPDNEVCLNVEKYCRKFPAIGDKIMLAAQQLGVILALPEPFRAIAQRDTVLAASGGITKPKDSDDYCITINMNNYKFDNDLMVWRKANSLGDKIDYCIIKKKSDISESVEKDNILKDNYIHTWNYLVEEKIGFYSNFDTLLEPYENNKLQDVSHIEKYILGSNEEEEKTELTDENQSTHISISPHRFPTSTKSARTPRLSARSSKCSRPSTASSKWPKTSTKIDNEKESETLLVQGKKLSDVGPPLTPQTPRKPIEIDVKTDVSDDVSLYQQMTAESWTNKEVLRVPTASIVLDTKCDSSRRNDDCLWDKRGFLSVAHASKWLAAGRDISQKEIAKEHVPGYLSSRPDSSLSISSVNRRLEALSPRTSNFYIKNSPLSIQIH